MVQRRSALKAVGSIVTVGATLGSLPAVSARASSVAEFEEYTRRLHDPHGGVNQTAIATQGDGTDVVTQGDIGANTDLSVLHDPDLELASVEHVEFNDGHTIRQVATSEDGETLEISVGDDRFKLSLDTVERVLNRRLRFVKARNDIARRQLRQSRERSEIEPTEFTPQSDMERDGFSDGDTDTFSTPVTGDTYADVSDNYDSCQAATMGVVAGHGGVIASAWDEWILSSGDLALEFTGDYACRWGNVLATGFAESRFFVEKDGDEIADTHAYNRSSWIGGAGQESDEYTEGIFRSSTDAGAYRIVMENEIGTTALGWTTGASISMATQPGSDFEGDFFLDNYTIEGF